MRAVNKWLVRILLIAVLSPGMAVADGFYDEEEGPPGIPPSAPVTNPPSVTVDENGNANVDVGINLPSQFEDPALFAAIHGAGCKQDPGRTAYPECDGFLPCVIYNGRAYNCPTITLGKAAILGSNSTSGLSSSPNLSSDYTVSNPQQLLDFIRVQTAPGVKDDSANKQKIVDELNDELMLKSGIAALMVPTQVNDAVVEKTIALGIPAGLYVSQDAFTADASQLTPAGIQFFNQIKLSGSDIAVVTGSADRINLIRTQLIANGAAARQVLAAPAANMKNPNTVGVYIIRLPTVADYFVPASSGGN